MTSLDMAMAFSFFIYIWLSVHYGSLASTQGLGPLSVARETSFSYSIFRHMITHELDLLLIFHLQQTRQTEMANILPSPFIVHAA